MKLKYGLIQVLILAGFALFFIFFVQCEKSPPTVSFTASEKNALVNEEISFTNQSTGADTYQWYFGDGASSNEANPTHTYEKPGQYFVSLIASSGKTKNTAYLTVNVSKEFRMIFENAVYTTISVTVNGITKEVEPAEEVFFSLRENPEFISYYAETQGTTSNNDPIGEYIYWEYADIDVRELEEKFTRLIISENIFYLYIQSALPYSLTPIEVYSESEDYYFYEDIVIPEGNSGTRYRIGYYSVFPDITIYGSSADFENSIEWRINQHFFLPEEENQQVTLHTDEGLQIRLTMKSPQKITASPFAAPLLSTPENKTSIRDKRNTRLDYGKIKKRPKE